MVHKLPGNADSDIMKESMKIDGFALSDFPQESMVWEVNNSAATLLSLISHTVMGSVWLA